MTKKNAPTNELLEEALMLAWSEEAVLHIWTAGMLWGLLHNQVPMYDDPQYKQKMDEYDRAYKLLLDVNEFRKTLGVNPRELSREENDAMSVLYGANLNRLAKQFA